MASCRRAVQIGLSSRALLNKSREFKLLDAQICGFSRRQISQLHNPNGKRAVLVDTLALVKSLEAQGVPSKHAEAITLAITDSLENVSHNFVSKADMQKVEMLQEANISKFKSEAQGSQDHRFSLLDHRFSLLQWDIEKLRSDMRYEFDKLIHAQKAQLEAAKYDVIKYCIGSIVCISAVGLAVIGIM
ncbi:hypothetical protein Ancab_027367 [Ancistrocladus abbreviatus]